MYDSGGDVDNREVCMHRNRAMWETSVSSAQFFCEPKPALKTKSIKKINSDLLLYYSVND
jgi:hypothetical protein